MTITRYSPRTSEGVMLTVMVVDDSGSWIAHSDHEAALKATELGHARYEYVRTLNPHQFADLVRENISTGVAFDALVDRARGAAHD